MSSPRLIGLVLIILLRFSHSQEEQDEENSLSPDVPLYRLEVPTADPEITASVETLAPDTPTGTPVPMESFQTEGPKTPRESFETSSPTMEPIQTIAPETPETPFPITPVPITDAPIGISVPMESFQTEGPETPSESFETLSPTMEPIQTIDPETPVPNELPVPIIPAPITESPDRSALETTAPIGIPIPMELMETEAPEPTTSVPSTPVTSAPTMVPIETSSPETPVPTGTTTTTPVPSTVPIETPVPMEPIETEAPETTTPVTSSSPETPVPSGKTTPVPSTSAPSTPMEPNETEAPETTTPVPNTSTPSVEPAVRSAPETSSPIMEREETSTPNPSESHSSAPITPIASPDSAENLADEVAKTNFAVSLSPRTAVPSPSAKDSVVNKQKPNDEEIEKAMESEAILDYRGINTLSSITKYTAYSSLALAMLPLILHGFMANEISSVLAIVGYFQGLNAAGQLARSWIPEQLLQFTDVFSFANFVTAGQDSFISSRHLTQHDKIIDGVAAFADRLNIQPQNLFPAILFVYWLVLGTLFLLVGVIKFCSPSSCAKLPFKVAGVAVAFTLLSLYPLTVSSCFELRVYGFIKVWRSLLALVTLLVNCFGVLGLYYIVTHRTIEMRLQDSDFLSIWGPVYDDYVYEYRTFFVIKGAIDISTGIFIGAIVTVPYQLIFIVLIHLIFILLIFLLSPYFDRIRRNCMLLFMTVRMTVFALFSVFVSNSSSVSKRKEKAITWSIILLNLGLILLLFVYQLKNFIASIVEAYRRHKLTSSKPTLALTPISSPV